MNVRLEADLAAFWGRASVFEKWVSSYDAQFEADLAAKTAKVDALFLQLKRALEKPEVLRNESVRRTNSIQDIVATFDSVLDGTGPGTLKSPLSCLETLLGNLIPLLILAGGALLLYWIVIKYYSLNRGRNPDEVPPVYATVSTTPSAPS